MAALSEPTDRTNPGRTRHQQSSVTPLSWSRACLRREMALYPIETTHQKRKPTRALAVWLKWDSPMSAAYPAFTSKPLPL
jgi:hypothetical protein